MGGSDNARSAYEPASLVIQYNNIYSMKIIFSNYSMSKQSYAITIKVIKRDTESNEHDLRFYLNTVTKRHAATEIFHVFERDSKNRLHLHGEFIARRGIRYNLVKIPYVHIHITPLPTYEDQCQWYDYCHKEPVQEFIKRCVSEYSFVDVENAEGFDDPCDECTEGAIANAVHT